MRALFCIAVLLTHSILFASATNAEDYTLEDLAWLEGHWLEKRDNNVLIEVQWNSALGDAMTGTWRQTKDNVLLRYEILTMREIGGDIFYRFDLYETTDSGLFETSSTLRLRLMDAKENLAHFEIVGEENWVLTMDASDRILRGWMDNSNNPAPERRYNYFAAKQ